MFLKMEEPAVNGFVVCKFPPTMATVIGAFSLFWNSSRALVGRPLTNLTPKTSASGNDAEAVTSRFGSAVDCSVATTCS